MIVTHPVRPAYKSRSTRAGSYPSSTCCKIATVLLVGHTAVLQQLRGNMAAGSDSSSALQPFYQLSPDSTIEQDEEPRAPIQCSDARPSLLCCNCARNIVLSAACSEKLSRAPLPASPVFSMPPRTTVPCSDARSSLCYSYSRFMDLCAAVAACSERPLPSQQDLRHEQDEEIVSRQFCLRALVQCSDDEQFILSSIQEEKFDKEKTELVCSSSNG